MRDSGFRNIINRDIVWLPAAFLMVVHTPTTIRCLRVESLILFYEYCCEKCGKAGSFEKSQGNFPKLYPNFRLRVKFGKNYLNLITMNFIR